MRGEVERVRRAEVSDIPELSRLFTSVFAQNREDEVWRWKYFSHPIGAWSFVFEADGKIVAHCGATAVRFRAHEREILAMQLVDFMSRPDFPGGIGGGGPFARTTTAMFRTILNTTQVRLLYGFPGERHRLVGQRLLGYRTAGPVGELTLRPSGAGSAHVRSLRPSDLRQFEDIPSPLHARRDLAFLRWRYLERPDARYEIVEARRRWFGRAPAAAIVRRGENGIHLMETGGSFAPHALNELVEQLRALGGEVKGWCSPSHPTTIALTGAGFELVARDHSLAAAWFLDRPQPERRAYFEDVAPAGADFYVTLGDYDVY